jgi:FkbM family methyltransferase
MADVPPSFNTGQRLLRRLARRALPRGLLVAPGLRKILGIESNHGHVVDRHGRLRIEYSLDSVIGQLLFINRKFEEAEGEFIRQRLRAIDSAVFVDIGANIGLHSLRAALLENVARIFAFEPARSTFEMLNRNVDRNGFSEKICPLPLALSSRPGRAEFHFCADDAYSSLKPDDRRPVKQSYEVEVTTLDDWTASNQIDRLDLIKIDVEGSEPEVIAGAEATIKRWRPELVVEIFQGNRREFSALGLVDRIRSFGYQAFVLVDGTPRPFDHHDDEHFNYYFAPAINPRGP